MITLASSQNVFQGAVLDTGAEKSVVGIEQARAYASNSGIPFVMETISGARRFRFGKDEAVAQVSFIFIVPTPNGPLRVRADVVTTPIPLLIGLDVLDKYKLNVLTVENQLTSVSHGWKIPLERRNGHVYLTWNPRAYCIMFSSEQLRRFHQHFHHPSAGILYELLTRSEAKTGDLPPDTLKVLK
jgi:hypothetical protein